MLDKLQRLYKLVEDGVAEIDDLLKKRIAKLKADRDKATAALERIEAQGPTARLDADKIARFGALMRQDIIQGDIPFPKAYLRS